MHATRLPILAVPAFPAVLSVAAFTFSRSTPAGDGGQSVQSPQPFVQNPAVIDLPDEAAARVRELARAAGPPAKPVFESVHDFLSPFELAGFASKGDRVFVVRVGGYDLKGSPGAGSRFVWINGRGEGVWEP